MQRIRDVRTGVSSRIETARQLPARTKEKIGSAAVKTWSIFTNVLSATLSIIFLAIMSLLIYGTFYYGYIPSPLIQAPLTLQFRPCLSSPGKCSPLSGSHNLSEILMNDQLYVIAVRLDLPESPANRNHGMFMSCLAVYAKDETLLREECKSSLLPHRSFLVRQLRNFIFSPGTALGYMNEKETLEIEFLKDFIDNDPYNPAKRVKFILKSQHLDVYSAELRIRADFKGIRAFMYYYPLTATLLGSLFYLSLFIFVMVISWCRIGHEEDDEEIGSFFQVGREEEKDDIDVIKSQINLNVPIIEELGSSLDTKKKDN